jgi:hypothetical protein
LEPREYRRLEPDRICKIRGAAAENSRKAFVIVQPFLEVEYDIYFDGVTYSSAADRSA